MSNINIMITLNDRLLTYAIIIHLKDKNWLKYVSDVIWYDGSKKSCK